MQESKETVMAGTSGISGYGTSTLRLVDFLSEQEDNDNSLLGTSAAAAKAKNLINSANTAAAKKANSAYNCGVNSAVGQAALSRAIAEMQSKMDGPITFSKIAQYQKDLEAEFSANVRVALVKAGVDPSVEFTLTLSPEGAIQVDTDDPLAKEAIQKFLKDNPKVCEDFGYIQALANLERARQSSPVTSLQGLRDTKATIQASAVEAFFGQASASGMNYASVLANFSGDSDSTAKFYAGIDFTV